jgi:hypothetical protein
VEQAEAAEAAEAVVVGATVRRVAPGTLLDLTPAGLVSDRCRFRLTIIVQRARPRGRAAGGQWAGPL